jgi:putative transcriptional regulator
MEAMGQRIVTRATAGCALALAAMMAVGADAGRVYSKPAKGLLLIASPRLRDPNFTRTVVLLTDYGPGGAMGFVINRPTDVAISHAVPELIDLSRADEKVFIGGPVRGSELWVLVRSRSQPERAHHVFDDVYLTGSGGSRLKEIVDGDGAFRVLAGHAGWGPGQLDAEVARGDWLIKSADAESIFGDGPPRQRPPTDPAWSAELRVRAPSTISA